MDENMTSPHKGGGKCCELCKTEWATACRRDFKHPCHSTPQEEVTRKALKELTQLGEENPTYALDSYTKEEVKGDGSVPCCENGDMDEKHDCMKKDGKEDVRGDWEESLTEIVAVNADPKKVERFVDEVKSLLEQTRTQCREEVKKFAQAVIDSDKTPRYDYSRSDVDRNNNGELPKGGSRWATPKELAMRFLATLSTGEK